MSLDEISIPNFLEKMPIQEVSLFKDKDVSHKAKILCLSLFSPLFSLFYSHLFEIEKERFAYCFKRL